MWNEMKRSIKIMIISQIKHDKQKQQNQGQGQNGEDKPSESIGFKDLPPDGQVQMAAQAGIQIAQPQPIGIPGAAPQPAPIMPGAKI